jgi:hypothetical protein
MAKSSAKAPWARTRQNRSDKAITECFFISSSLGKGGGTSPEATMMLSQENKKSEWLSKKRQMQGAQLSKNEAY